LESGGSSDEDWQLSFFEINRLWVVFCQQFRRLLKSEQSPAPTQIIFGIQKRRPNPTGLFAAFYCSFCFVRFLLYSSRVWEQMPLMINALYCGRSHFWKSNFWLLIFKARRKTPAQMC
jgi:hypothetical protein